MIGQSATGEIFAEDAIPMPMKGQRQRGLAAASRCTQQHRATIYFDCGSMERKISAVHETQQRR